MADATTLSVLITARDQASAAFQKIEGNMGRMAAGFEKHRKTIGIAMAGAGAAITGLAATAVKSSMEQQQGINLLDAALKNVGSSYAANRGEIEKNISALQRKTNYGDEEQRKILTKLVGIIGDEEQAMAALPAVLDAAAFSGKDAGAVSETLGKFMAGLTNTSDATGASVDKQAGFQERLAEVMGRVGGSAEADANAMTQLGNTMGDLHQVVGDALLPILETLVPMLDAGVQAVQKWTEENPLLTKVLVIVGAALGGVMLVLGPMLLILPALSTGMGIFATGIKGVGRAIAANPIGAILTVLTILAVTVLPLVLKNWDKIWNTILKLTERVVNVIIKIVNGMTLVYRKAFAAIVDLVKAAMDKLPDFIKKVIPGFDAVRDSLDSVSETLKEGIPPIEIYNEKQVELATDVERSSEEVVDAVGRQQQAWETTSEVVNTQTGKMKTSVEGFTDTHATEIDKQLAKQKEWTEKNAHFRQLNADAALEARVAESAAGWAQIEDNVNQIRARMEADKQFRIDEKAAMDQALADLRFSLDETNIKWNESGATIKTVVKDWASQMGISADDVMDKLGEMETDARDWSAVLGAAMTATGRSFDFFTTSVDRTTDAYKALIIAANDVEENLLDPSKSDYASSRARIAEQEAAREAARLEALEAEAKKAEQAAAIAKASANKILAGMREDIEVSDEKFTQIQVTFSPTQMGTKGQTPLEGMTGRGFTTGTGTFTVAQAITGFRTGRQREILKDVSDADLAREIARQNPGAALGDIAKHDLTREQFEAAAHGGLSHGGLTLVGERGPELVSLPRGAFVHPSGTGPGGGVTLIFNGDVYGVDDLREVVVEAVRDHAISGGFAGVFGEP